ncbi:hypothetical protein ACFSJS_09730 [Streptomyces desertarenae]|uniref:Uncharacterized protein n=1 Tax=Streptomyces desertarenae TaxID=2666184 RepID=A0ABW4PIB1_9ACTN
MRVPTQIPVKPVPSPAGTASGNRISGWTSFLASLSISLLAAGAAALIPAPEVRPAPAPVTVEVHQMCTGDGAVCHFKR